MRQAAQHWWCFYDGDCPLCQGMVARFRVPMANFGGRCASLQGSPLARALPPPLLLKHMRVWTGRRLLGGAQAVGWMLGRAWFFAPIPILISLPGLRHLAERSYQFLARNRHCFQGACTLPQASTK